MSQTSCARLVKVVIVVALCEVRRGCSISTEIMLGLYKAFILPDFRYCSLVWHFSGGQDSDKLDLLNNVFFDLFSRVLTLSTTIYLKGQELQTLRISAYKVKT